MFFFSFITVILVNNSMTFISSLLRFYKYNNQILQHYPLFENDALTIYKRSKLVCALQWTVSLKNCFIYIYNIIL